MGKRTFDFALSVLGLTVLSPVLLFIAALIWISDCGPVLYVAPRVGKDGRTFNMVKFRTMIPGADRLGASSTSSDDARLTGIGRWLRRYKIDEFPQLWNVAVGDMSLVGPRPQVPWAVERYSPSEKIVLTIRPGITDPASLRFANEAEILRGHPDPDKAYFELIHPEKMRLAIDYVNTHTFWGDFRILLATVAAPMRRSSQSPLEQDL